MKEYKVVRAYLWKR